MRIQTLNTLAFDCFRGFSKKTPKRTWLFAGISPDVSATDLVKASKDAASLLVCTPKKNLLVGRCGFFVSDVISGGLFGHLEPLCLALGANR